MRIKPTKTKLTIHAYSEKITVVVFLGTVPLIRCLMRSLTKADFGEPYVTVTSVFTQVLAATPMMPEHLVRDEPMNTVTINFGEKKISWTHEDNGPVKIITFNRAIEVREKLSTAVDVV